MLAERGLSEVVSPTDVERLFTRYTDRFRQYIDDPLWPPFKFPLTANEQTKLRNKLKLGFDQLNSTFEEIALKVKYGGVSDELKTKTRYEIAGAIQQLLPQTAFLRNPPYPGVSCRFRGRYGFAAVIEGPLYVEGQRPREKFKAMKYFHLGHRLEEVVIRERELAQGKSKESESEKSQLDDNPSNLVSVGQKSQFRGFMTTAATSVRFSMSQAGLTVMSQSSGFSALLSHAATVPMMTGAPRNPGFFWA